MTIPRREKNQTICLDTKCIYSDPFAAGAKGKEICPTGQGAVLAAPGRVGEIGFQGWGVQWGKEICPAGFQKPGVPWAKRICLGRFQGWVGAMGKGIVPRAKSAVLARSAMPRHAGGRVGEIRFRATWEEEPVQVRGAQGKRGLSRRGSSGRCQVPGAKKLVRLASFRGTGLCRVPGAKKLVLASFRAGWVPGAKKLVLASFRAGWV